MATPAAHDFSQDLGRLQQTEMGLKSDLNEPSQSLRYFSNPFWRICFCRLLASCLRKDCGCVLPHQHLLLKIYWRHVVLVVLKDLLDVCEQGWLCSCTTFLHEALSSSDMWSHELLEVLALQLSLQQAVDDNLAVSDAISV